MITCARCNVVAPIDADELTDPGGDSDLLPLIVPPWVGCPTPTTGTASSARAAPRRPRMTTTALPSKTSPSL